MPVSFAVSISGIDADPQQNSAAITWLTDVSANGTVHYGLTKTTGSILEHSDYITDHEIILASLEESRQYYYKISSVDLSGTEIIDDNSGAYYTFTTKDSQAPARVIGLAEDSVGLNYIKIKWAPASESDIMKYMIFRDNINIANTTQAEYKDSGLLTDTTYQYKVAAVDTSYNIGQVSAVKQITTLVQDYTSPKISELAIQDLHSSSARIRWLTDEESSSIVYYGSTVDVENKTEKNESVDEHLVEITGLLDGEIYHYKVKSCDANDNCVESEINKFRTGEDNEPPTIEAELPDWHNGNRLEITGKTEPLARVRVYVNDELKRAVNTESDGIFKFSGISLDTKLESNKVKLVAIDQVGFEAYLEKQIFIDTEPPIFNITQLSEYTNEQNVVLEGSVNEEVTLEIDVVSGGKKLEFLPQVSNLKLVRAEENSVELEWDTIEDESLAGYLIYRNGKKMTSYTDNHFIDPALNKSRKYTYEVAAYNHKCTEGQKSAPVSITVSANASELDDSFEEMIDYCTQEDYGYESVLISGSFSQNVDLQDGKNLITITATDKAGNSVTIEQETIVETEQPVIMEHNLRDLSPSYIRDVTVKGEVSKKQGQEVIVTVYVNDKPYSELANEDGTFSVHIKLEKELYHEINEETDYDPERRVSSLYASYEPGSWKNNIKIIASTVSGLESDPEEGEIILAICGYGSWWSIDLGEASPSILTPRLMLEGLAQIGIPVNNIKWQGGSIRKGKITFVRMRFPELSDADKERYDLDWVNQPQYMEDWDQTKGYVLLNVKKLDSGSLFMDSEEAKEGRSEDELTTLEMEDYLYKHRLEEGDCLVPGYGCIRIPLMMEIHFSYDDANGSTTFAYERKEIEEGIQRQCWDIEIAIDKRLPSNKLPESFLRSAIDLINESITAIDQILVPLNTIKQVLFIGCAATMVMDYVIAVQESFKCEFSDALNIFSESDEKWDIYIAKTGQCEDQGYDSDQEAACKQCEDAIRSRKNFEKKMHLVCDRIFCPSAPTFQKYVRDMVNKYKNVGDKNIKKIESDCALYRDEIKDEKYQDSNIKSYKPQGLPYKDIDDIYKDYKNQKKAEKGEGEKDCSDLHIPTKDCCGYEYMEQWDSACLVMDELKESKCVALEESTDMDINEDPDCGSIRKFWNSAAGFCEPDGRKPGEVVNAHDTFKKDGSITEIDEYKDETGRDVKVIYLAGESRQSIWFRTIPERFTKSISARDASPAIQFAEIGHVTSNMESAQSDFEPGKPSRVSTQRVFVPLTQFGYFEIDTATTEEYSDRYNKKARNDFIDKYYDAVGEGYPNRADEVYILLQDHFGTTDKEYIADPRSGLLRSVQCVCLPGITSYLGLWKKILQAMQICFQTVLMTGDGSTGMCKALLSVYVCDLFYEFISCFKNKFSAGHKRETSGGIGNFMGALTSAGSKVSDSVAGRYGDSPIWKTMFVEKKVVHSACLWAFTGTWDLDVMAMLEEDVSIDVETVAVPYPCKRRFISFNPASNPSGLTTYNYHLGLGMVAGSQLSYNVHLICSDDYSCNTPTGECDCAKLPQGKQTLRINIGPGTASRGQIIDEEEYINVDNAFYRYDKVHVTWTSADSDKSSDKPIVCNIKDVGDSAPAFCKFDIAEGRYRCELETGEEDYIRFFNEPTTAEPVYYPGNNIIIKLQLSQRQPTEVTAGREFNEYTKYMVMELYNQNNGLVWSSAGKLYPFNGNGQHIQDFPIPYKLKDTDFWIKGVSSAITVARGTVHNKRLIQDTRYEEVQITIKGGNVQYSKSFTFARDITGEKIGLTNEEIVFDGDAVYYKEEGNTIASVVYRTSPQDSVIRIKRASSTGEDCTTQLHTWKLHIDFYTSSDVPGDSSTQHAMYQNKEVMAEVPVKVRCLRPVDTRTPGCTVGKITDRTCLCGGKPCEKGWFCNQKSKTVRVCEPKKDDNPYVEEQVEPKITIKSAAALVEKVENPLSSKVEFNPNQETGLMKIGFVFELESLNLAIEKTKLNIFVDKGKITTFDLEDLKNNQYKVVAENALNWMGQTKTITIKYNNEELTPSFKLEQQEEQP